MAARSDPAPESFVFVTPIVSATALCAPSTPNAPTAAVAITIAVRLRISSPLSLASRLLSASHLRTTRKAYRSTADRRANGTIGHYEPHNVPTPASPPAVSDPDPAR